MLYRSSDRGELPAGSFDSEMSFAQSLTKAAKAVPRVLVVASLPASDIETGGEGGHEALARLKNIFVRVGAGWRPASADESFEIVRRRLFQDMQAADYPARDAVLRAYSDLYRSQAREFPTRCAGRVSTAHEPPIRSIRSCSTGCTRIGPPWSGSSAPAACCA